MKKGRFLWKSVRTVLNSKSATNERTHKGREREDERGSAKKKRASDWYTSERKFHRVNNRPGVHNTFTHTLGVGAAFSVQQQLQLIARNRQSRSSKGTLRGFKVRSAPGRREQVYKNSLVKACFSLALSLSRLLQTR